MTTRLTLLIVVLCTMCVMFAADLGTPPVLSPDVRARMGTNAPPLPPMTRGAARQAAAIVTADITITLTLTPGETPTSDTSFNLYHGPTPTGPWTLFTNVTSLSLTLSVPPVSRFYSVRTYSAFHKEEASFSEAVWMPPFPAAPSNLSIKR